MDHSFVWHPEPDGSPITAATGLRGLSLPHLLERAERQDGGIRATLNAHTLALGLLLAPEPRPGFVPGPRPTDETLRAVLHLCAADLGCLSADELASRLAVHLRESDGDDPALRALRRAVQLIPESTFARGDLIVALFVAAGQVERERLERMNEAAERFAEWRHLDTAGCRNEDWVWYAGLAALTYLDRGEDRGAALREIPDRVVRSSRIGSRLDRLRMARPWNIDAVKLG